MTTDCTLSTKSIDKDGYSRPNINGRRVYAHREALAKKLGRPIALGMLALHTCHNAPCINENHLYEGAHQDNSDDKLEAGRWKGNEKLHPKEVEAIRLLFGIRSGSAIAKMFGVSEGTISEIRTGKVHQ